VRRRGLLVAAGSCSLIQQSVAEVDWPTWPITLVVPFAPGGIADVTARTVSEAMSRELGQTIVIDNRPSAGSVVGTGVVAKAAPDGYTLLLMSNANAVSTGLFKKLPFDIVKDFAPITTLGYFDLGVFVGAGSRHATLKDLIAAASAAPGQGHVTLGTISVGSTQHLAAELFRAKAGIDALIVPYKGTPAVQTALRTGEVDAAFEILGPMLPQLRGQVVRILAVTSPRRTPTLPDVPTVIESGVADYAVASWNALAAPIGTPAATIARLNRAATAALAQPALRQRLQDLGVRAQTGTPQQLQALLGDEIKRWGEVIRAAKITPE
jgi:tripartite-type tricarboxylate transporter receptor subunit TctC